MGYSLQTIVEVCKESELLQHFNQQYKHKAKKKKIDFAYRGHANENSFAEKSRVYRSRTSLIKKSEAGNTPCIPSTHIFIGAVRMHNVHV